MAFNMTWHLEIRDLFAQVLDLPQFVRQREAWIYEDGTFPPSSLPPEVIEAVLAIRAKGVTSYRPSPEFEKRGGLFQQRFTEALWPIRYSVDPETKVVVMIPSERAELAYEKCETLYQGKENVFVRCP